MASLEEQPPKSNGTNQNSTNGSPSSDVLRLDKNILQNSFNFGQFSKDPRDEFICRNLFVYLFRNYNYRKDLFGYIAMTAPEFAKAMNFTLKQTKDLYDDIYANPLTRDRLEQLDVIKPKEFEKLYKENADNIFVTRLENCIYSMLRNNFVFTIQGKLFNGQEYIHTKGIQIITDVRLIKPEKRNGRGYKKTMYIQVNTELATNMEHFFAFINMNQYNSLKKENYKKIYLFLCNVRNNLVSSTSFTYSFENLRDLCDISPNTNVRRIKLDITKAITDTLNECPQLNLSFGWAKLTPTSKFAYSPNFQLTVDPKIQILSDTDNKDPKSLLLDKKKVYDDILIIKCIDHLFEKYCQLEYKKSKPDLDIETMGNLELRETIISNFWEWISSDSNIQVKIDSVTAIYEKNNPKSPILKMIASSPVEAIKAILDDVIPKILSYKFRHNVDILSKTKLS